MEKNVVRLTESQMKALIDSSVRMILESEMNEGWFDTMKSFAGQYGKRGADKVHAMGQKVNNAVKQGVKNVADKASAVGQQVKQDVQNTWNNAKQDGSMKDMQKAFNNFKVAVEKFKAAGGKVNGQLNSRIKGIDNMLNGYQTKF